MSKVRFPATALVVGASLAATAAFGQAPIPPADVSHEVPAIPKALTPPKIPHPATEVAEEEDLELTQSALQGSPGALRPAAISVAAGTALPPPVTITYSGSSVALSINDSGTNRGLNSLLTNTTNTNSAVFGQTAGVASGVKGVSTGASGYGGSFVITNAANAKPALYATTNGTGSAILATSTKTNSNQPVIMGSNTASSSSGIGVEGVGNLIGLYGLGNSSGGYGVFGSAPHGTGVYGLSTSDIAVYGSSTSSNGVYAYSYNGEAALHADSVIGRGVTAHSTHSYGIYASSDSSIGIWGQSKDQYGVIGEDSGAGTGVYGYSATGSGVYGSSTSGYAGYFNGKVGAASFVTVSDRNAKTGFKPVDGGSVLELVSRLPITSWAFKEDPKQRHIGPMAQDFHAAFGLSGTDDKHINLSDAAGVSLVAIQELTKRLQEKDARIAALESMNNAFSARLAKLEEQASANPQIVTASVPSGR